jgi:hypothetical protein
LKQPISNRLSLSEAKPEAADLKITFPLTAADTSHPIS